MFKQRLMTTIILVPLVLWAILFANHNIVIAVFSLILLVGGMEWMRLIPVHSVPIKIALMFSLIITFALSSLFFNVFLILVMLAWIFIVIAIFSFPASQTYWGNTIVVAIWMLLLLGILPSTFMQVIFSYHGAALIIYLLFLVWAADIGGYLIGKLWGGVKIIPKVSPGKTITGTLGGIALSLIVTMGSFIILRPHSFVSWVAISLLTVIMSIFGDLFISILKRRCNLKDTGTLIPGHGGVLDRMDSLIAAMPIYYLGLRMTGYLG